MLFLGYFSDALFLYIDDVVLMKAYGKATFLNYHILKELPWGLKTTTNCSFAIFYKVTLLLLNIFTHISLEIEMYLLYPPDKFINV